MTRVYICFVAFATIAVVSAATLDNRVDGRIRTGEDLLTSVFTECGSMTCVKDKVLNYLDTILGLSDDSARAYKSKSIDKMIFARIMRLLKTYEFQADLPGDAKLVYKPTTGLDIDLPVRPEDDETTVEARGILKKKLLLPVLLLLKLKLKALMPIFVGLIGLKALKALILSKLAITVVLGFLIFQLIMKKGGMSMMPMMMTMTSMPPAEPPSNAYGSPVSPATPMSSYEPGWEPSGGQGGPYSRVWSNSPDSSSSLSSSSSSAHNMAYSAYYPSSASSTNEPTY